MNTPKTVLSKMDRKAVRQIRGRHNRGVLRPERRDGRRVFALPVFEADRVKQAGLVR